MQPSRPAILGLLLALIMVLAACGSGAASSAPATGDAGDGGGAGETVSLAGGQDDFWRQEFLRLAALAESLDDS